MNQFCDCKEDGWCTRYQREQRGRFREICAGINCDLGTSAAFREQWKREAGTAAHLNPKVTPIPLLLKTDQAPGDAVAMTAAIYSLHKAHPGKYVTWVESPYPEVFQYNPDVMVGDDEHKAIALNLQMHYPAIHKSNQRGIHFMQGWCEFLGFALDVDVPLMTNKPHLYFDIDVRTQEGRTGYWVICSGGKREFTNKLWGQHNYQHVVSACKHNWIQVGGKREDHPPLSGSYLYDFVGKTNLRELFELVGRSKGVVCGVSLLMHVAAALDKPCIVIAGGREPVQWNAYPKQHYLHTVGMLPCSSPQGDVGGACWRSRTLPLGDNAILDEHTCQRPIGHTPECMTLIDPKQVTELVLKIDKQYMV